MHAVVRLLTVICVCAGGHAVATGSDPKAVEPDQSVSQPSALAPAGVTPTTPAETTPSHLLPAKGASDAVLTPTSANRPRRIILRDDTLNDAQLKQILAKGYKPEGRGDEVFYCRREAELGTRLKTKVCRTATVILALELQGKDVTQHVQKDNGNPR